jgi:hypothetical protein
MSDLSPLSGVKRTLDFGAVTSAFDPRRTLAPLVKLVRRHDSIEGKLCRGVGRCALVRTIGRARLTTPKVQPTRFRSLVVVGA